MATVKALERREELARRMLETCFAVPLAKFAVEYSVSASQITQDLRHDDYLAYIDEHQQKRYVRMDHRGNAILEQALSMAEKASAIQDAAFAVMKDDPLAALRLLDKASEAFYKGVDLVKWLKAALDPRFNPKLNIALELTTPSPSDTIPGEIISDEVRKHMDSARFTELPETASSGNGKDNGSSNGEGETNDE